MSINVSTQYLSPALKETIKRANSTPVEKSATKPNYKNSSLSSDIFMSKKKKTTEQKIMLSLEILKVAISIALSLVLFRYFNKSLGLLKKDGVKKIASLWEDISNTPKLKDMSLSNELQEILNKVIKGLSEGENIAQRGGKPIKSVLLYGPPGTGKTTFVKAIAKEFPNSRFANIDVTTLGSKYINETEKNIHIAVDEICKEAQEFPNTKFFVFIDEIDSVMMVDTSSSKKHSNNVLNEFKRCFTEKLGRHDNIITLGATNLTIDPETATTAGEKFLDKAMLDRFQEKIFIDFPTKEQILDCVVANYSNKTLVDDELKSILSNRLNIIAEFLSDKKHETSFRTLQSLFNNAALNGDLKTKVGIIDLFNAIKSKKTELKISDIELSNLAKELGIN